MTTNARMQALTDAGVSAWLDDLSRERITSGSLARMVADLSVRGVTTNPTIFEKAISGGAAAYADQLRSLAASGADVDAIIRALTTDDVRVGLRPPRPGCGRRAAARTAASPSRSTRGWRTTPTAPSRRRRSSGRSSTVPTP